MKSFIELMGTGVTLSQGDKSDGVSERHFIKQFGSIMQGIGLNIKVKKNVLSEQVKRSATLENVTVEMLPSVWVGAVLDNLLEHVGVGMRIQSRKTWLVLVMDVARGK